MTSQDRRKPLHPASEPSARSSTLRESLIEALRAETLSAKEASARTSMPERDVVEHLPHIERSLSHKAERLNVLPPRCVACGFVFDSRERRGKPSRCPACRSERIEPARFRIAPR